MSTTINSNPHVVTRMSVELVKLLNAVFVDLIGPATTGNVTFCRCLAPSVVEALSSSAEFAPPDWEVKAVVEIADISRRWITSDQAVEMREDKGGAILLLIDVGRAGAGMDGIYSASRELTEDMLFKQTRTLVKREVGRELFAKAELAITQVRYVGERKSLSKWQQIEFFATLYGQPKEFGRSVSALGLWPIRGEADAIGDRDLQISARMIDRLFLGSGNASTPAERVQALLLEDSKEEQEIGLQRLVRKAARSPLSDVVEQVVSQPNLWLNAIKPRFLNQQLQNVTIRPWRDKKGKIGKWSGLADGNPPQFLLSTERVSKLEIRFDTEPEQLPKGSVEYRVSVMAGDDELAYRHVSHAVRKGSQYQTVKLTTEDFENISEDSQFEARVVVSVVGLDIEIEDESEEFLIRYGEAPIDTTSNTSKFERCLVEGAAHIADGEQFDADVTNPDCFEINSAKNHITFRAASSKKSYKVQRPALIDVLERLQSEQSEIGRWSVRVREDGQRVGEPEFHAIDRDDVTDGEWDKAIRAMAAIRKDLSDKGGFWGSVYSAGLAKRAEAVINSWLPMLDQASAMIALAETIEVQSLSGKTIGLIVLPSHPLRIAWHMGYDQLLRYLRYDIGLSSSRANESVENLHASHVPSILPGLEEGKYFVYADTLSFFATAMVSDSDKEPKSAVAMLMRTLGLNEHDPSVSSMGFQVSTSLAREISRYIQFHGLAKSSGGAVLLHALRPGDGGTVARALGKALRETFSGDEEAAPVRFNLEMFPAQPGSDLTGNFLVDLVERHRTGAAGIADEDRWMLESQSLVGGLTLPRLRWAKKNDSQPASPCHLAITFDSFDTRVDFLPLEQLTRSAPLHVYGLVANTQRTFDFKPAPQWLSWTTMDADGEKHPVARIISERLVRLNKAIMRCVCRHARRGDDHWPVLRTTLSANQQDTLRIVHQLSDWVITVDRNAGIEFFDAPREEPTIYETYVIDCVPERDDLGSLQMITSTTRTDEIRELLDQMLEKMSLSASRRNCEFLVRHLKALSGRLAMRLTSLGSTSSELIALALLHSQCENASDDDKGFWMSLTRGFFVPVDDIPDLAPKEKRLEDHEADKENAPNVRSDLIYVSLPGRGGLSFTFVEVKYRRNLRAARAPELAQQIEDQTQGHRSAWMSWYFDVTVTEPVSAIRRSRLVRALRFYLEKARRHYLTEERYERFRQQLDRWMIDGTSYKISESPIQTRGYIFCPEFVNREPATVSDAGAATKLVLFGATTMPDLAVGIERTPMPDKPADANGDDGMTNVAVEVFSSGLELTFGDESTSPDHPNAVIGTSSTSDSKMLSSAGSTPDTPPVAALIRFGVAKSSDEPVEWPVTRAANPHLMIVGFPGMGKTEAVMNICQQLRALSITPIVFSYHPDIDERLSSKLTGVRMLDHHQLGFNPMHIDTPSPTAHVDSAGMLRDVFAAMFPELGDIQLECVRRAIRESYVRHGWGGGESDVPSIPEFRDFYAYLKREPKPEKNLLARLDELDDYQVFSNTGDVRSLLDSNTPMVLQIHATQNEMVQRAVAMLALYNIYKEMFRRGVQDCITHAVVFDEAHRASKMRLLPKLAAECRKFGISLILASQSAKDFDTALFSNIASYLLLRMTDQDANVLAKNITTSDQAKRTADRLKQLDKYNALFFREGQRHPTHVELDPPS